MISLSIAGVLLLFPLTLEYRSMALGAAHGAAYLPQQEKEEEGGGTSCFRECERLGLIRHDIRKPQISGAPSRLDSAARHSARRSTARPAPPRPDCSRIHASLFVRSTPLAAD